MEEDKDKENEIHERNVSYNTKRKSDKIKEEISIDIENNNQEEEEEDTKEKIIDRMVDRNYNTSNKTEQGTKQNSVLPSTENRTIYDLQTLLSQRQDRLESVLYERYKYNTSIKRGQDFLLNHVDSKLSLVVMYADLVGSTKMSMALPVERMAKIIKVFSHELSSVVESYNGFVLKYVGDAVIACFPSGFNKYLSCDTAFQCAKSMITVIKNGINPVLNQYDYPEMTVRVGIDMGDNVVVQYGWGTHLSTVQDKQEVKKSHFDILGYTISIAAKMTTFAKDNQIVIGQFVYDMLDDSQKSTFKVLPIGSKVWNYVSNSTGEIYGLYGSSMKK